MDDDDEHERGVFFIWLAHGAKKYLYYWVIVVFSYFSFSSLSLFFFSFSYSARRAGSLSS